MTDFWRSARFRLALTWSVGVLVAASLLLVVINLAVARSLSDEPVTREVLVTRQIGNVVVLETTVVTYFDEFEQAVNDRTLSNLRRLSALAVLGLFPVSLGVGFVVAARVLEPVDRITRVARAAEPTDLSERIHLEGPDDELKRLADTFDGMLDRIAAGVADQRELMQNASHELRTPLAVATTNLEVALLEDDPEAVRERSRIAHRALGRLRHLVDDLFLYARQQGRELIRDDVDLDELVRSAAAEFGPSASERGLALEVVGGGAGEVRVEREGVERALANLVSNAVRLAPTGSTVRLGSGRVDDWRWLGVRDEGPGIPEDQHELVFRRFWRASDGGTGLGLAIVRQVAEAHHGEVILRSAPGVGSSFVIWLPAGPEGPGSPPPVDPLAGP